MATRKPMPKGLFGGKESMAEELKEAKAIKSGKITPMQYAKGEKSEEKMKGNGRSKRFDMGGTVDRPLYVSRPAGAATPATPAAPVAKDRRGSLRQEHELRRAARRAEHDARKAERDGRRAGTAPSTTQGPTTQPSATQGQSSSSGALTPLQTTQAAPLTQPLPIGMGGMGMKRGGEVKKMARGGGVESKGKTKGKMFAAGGSVSGRADGIAAKGKTKCKVC